jgi:hypothetical protein
LSQDEQNEIDSPPNQKATKRKELQKSKKIVSKIETIGPENPEPKRKQNRRNDGIFTAVITRIRIIDPILFTNAENSREWMTNGPPKGILRLRTVQAVIRIKKSAVFEFGREFVERMSNTLHKFNREILAGNLSGIRVPMFIFA